MLRFRLLHLLFALACSATPLADAGTSDTDAQRVIALSPPGHDEPTDVLLDFALYDVNNIDGVSETFEFTGVLKLTWRDPRQAFDPDIEGVREKIYQGDHQFGEVVSLWYPQVVLLNQAGGYDITGVQLRIRSDGTLTLTQMITAVAETELDMRAFPFDAHRLEAVFVILGHTVEEVNLRSEHTARNDSKSIRIPGWSLDAIALSTQDYFVGGANPVPAAILSIRAARKAVYIRRLITFPMFVIVLLSFSIFWMDKSSLADRNSISFIGVLTNVSFQQSVMSVTPPVSYITLLNAFLFISFLLVALTVPINLIVAHLDKKGRFDLGDKVDRQCRWLFPLVYFSLTAVIGVVLLN